ncbi:hypothetical protein T459_18349 [Capsicum annuum]|uniref:NTF2 domain-containing protein n=1 Tax=Capsicum annuum TaxID=4072 RepID=A0A2G2ZE65_CAPAN|nr:hypothetical protein T459_18349 [Capsicum annuum]
MAAEAAAVAAVTPVSAQVVANAFVQQYYHILHHSPGLVFRFYQDISKLGRPEDDGSMGITTTMQAINDKILSLNYGDFRAEIKSVDAQESFNGGVHVLVTGYLTGKDNLIRNFCQTFFLAPQDRGYFVLNDMFRYVETLVQPDTVQVPVANVVAPVTPEQIVADPPPVQQNHIPEESAPPAEEADVGEVYNPPENGDVPIVEDEVPVSEVVDEVQDVPEVVVESDNKIGETPKKSYASIVSVYTFKGLINSISASILIFVANSLERLAFAKSSCYVVRYDSRIEKVMHLKESAATFSPAPAPAPRKPMAKSVEQVNKPAATVTDGPYSSSDTVDNMNDTEGMQLQSLLLVL